MIKQIFNWTLGGFFRSLGKFLLYLCVALLVGVLLSSSNVKIPHFGLFGVVVKADTISVSGAQYNIYVDTNISNGCTADEGQNYKNLDTVSDLRSYNGGVSTFSAISVVDYVANATLQNGTQYSFDVVQSYNPKNISNYNNWVFSIEGSTTTSNSGLSADNITSYTCYVENVSNNEYQVKVHCDFIPKYTLQRLFVRVRTLCEPYSVNYFNTYTMRINSITSTENAINSQTTIIQNEFNETNQTITDMGDSIINAGNQNAQDIIDSNKVCSFYDKNSIIKSDTQININGVEEYAQGFGVTNFIKIDSSYSLEVIESFSSQKYVCFYDINKNKISCIQLNSFSGNISIPSNASYIRSTIYISANKPTFRLCGNGNQAITDTLENTDTSSESDDTIDFMNDFSSDSDSLISDLVTIPLTFIQSLILGEATDLCTTFKSQHICFPNGQRIIWNKANGGHFCTNDYFGCADSQSVTAFKNFFNLVAGGFLAYKLIKDAIRTIHNWLEPTHSKVEVMSL